MTTTKLLSLRDGTKALSKRTLKRLTATDRTFEARQRAETFRRSEAKPGRSRDEHF